MAIKGNGCLYVMCKFVLPLTVFLLAIKQLQTDKMVQKKPIKNVSCYMWCKLKSLLLAFTHFEKWSCIELQVFPSSPQSQILKIQDFQRLQKIDTISDNFVKKHVVLIGIVMQMMKNLQELASTWSQINITLIKGTIAI